MKFKALQVWRSIKRHPGCSRADVMADLRWRSDHSVSQIVMRLRVSGCARSEGHGRGTRWWALDKRPEDGRGQEETSQVAIRNQHRHWQANLVKAAQARGITLRVYPQVRPKATTALEAAWGFMPLSGEFASTRAVLSNRVKPADTRASSVGTAENEESATEEAA